MRVYSASGLDRYFEGGPAITGEFKVSEGICICANTGGFSRRVKSVPAKTEKISVVEYPMFKHLNSRYL